MKSNPTNDVRAVNESGLIKPVLTFASKHTPCSNTSSLCMGILKSCASSTKLYLVTPGISPPTAQLPACPQRAHTPICCALAPERRGDPQVIRVETDGLAGSGVGVGGYSINATVEPLSAHRGRRCRPPDDAPISAHRSATPPASKLRSLSRTAACSTSSRCGEAGGGGSAGLGGGCGSGQTEPAAAASSPSRCRR